MHIARWLRLLTVTALLLASIGLTMSAPAQSATSASARSATVSPAVHAAPRLAVSMPGPLRSPHTVGPVPSGVRNVLYTENWGGYVDTGTTFNTVTATWTQPRGACDSRQTMDAAFWVGLDGYTSDTVEQTGTLLQCEGVLAIYYAWYEVYPGAMVTYSSTVEPGDSLTATVAYSDGAYTMTLKDSTQGWTDTTTATGTYARSSAEVIVEAPSNLVAILPLASFGSVTFTGASVDGEPLNYSGFTSNQLDMESSGGTLEESTSSLNSAGDSFTGTWDAS